MVFDPLYYDEGIWRQEGMSEIIISVLKKVMLVDTKPERVEEKAAVVLSELPKYYSKQGIFSCPAVWIQAKDILPFQWWDQHGGNDMPVSGPLITKLQSMIPNQSSCERMLKAYKFVNSKERTNMGSLTATQFNSAESETTTRGIKMASVYLRTNSRLEWEDPSEQVSIDGEVYRISDLDKKEWAKIFAPAAPQLAAARSRVFLLKTETWEQPTKKSTEVFERLSAKYSKVCLLDEDENDDSDSDGSDAAQTVTRKIDTVTWKKGKGNSYVVNAFDVDSDGKLIRHKLTEYKIDSSLFGLIKAATAAGHNSGISFVDDIDEGEVDEPIVTMTPAEVEGIPEDLGVPVPAQQENAPAGGAV
jgi:hypothetical protein